MAKAFEKHDAETHSKAETARVPESLHGQICACVHGSSDFYPALKELHEENRFHLSQTRRMIELVPFILQEECSCTRLEVQGKHTSMVFDGNTRLGEVLVVLLRYMCIFRTGKSISVLP